MTRRLVAWLALAANGTVESGGASSGAGTSNRYAPASLGGQRSGFAHGTPQRYKNRDLRAPFVGYSPTTKFIFGAGGAIQFKTGESAYDSATRTSNVSAGFSVTTAGQWGISLSNDYFTLHNRWWFNRKSPGRLRSDGFLW